MGLVFRWVTGLELQYVWDLRSMLYSMGVGEVPYSDLIIDAAEALAEERVMYSGVSAQVSAKRGVHRLGDLEPGGRLHNEAIVMMRKGGEEGEAGAGARVDECGEGIGLVMRGVDVPTHMKPGRLLYRPTLCPPPSDPLPSILYPLPSTLCPLPSILYPLPSTLYPLPSTLYPLPPFPFPLATNPLTLNPSTLCPLSPTLYHSPSNLDRISLIQNPSTIRGHRPPLSPAGILRLYVSMGGLPGHAWTEGQNMSLVVHNVTPDGERRSARVGFERPSGGEERAVGAELRLMEEGRHILVSDPHYLTSCFLCVSFLLKPRAAPNGESP